jgi:lipoprotein-releasing system permease protein
VLISYNKLPLLRFGPERQQLLLQVFNIVAIIGGALAGLAKFFGCLRAFFTFFTTVPIGGVWIGTTALVMVLAVMSGFETDLRDKIVGSNAHLQITREDGDFVEWREVKDKLDRLPGVVASTPYVVSEVVVAANNQGMPVIIKGIDPRTVGLVTDLVSDLRGGQEAMQRLEPIVVDTHDLSVPQHPRTGPMIDPPPDDMPSPGEPIDYSGADTAGSGAGSGSASATRSRQPAMPEPGSAGSPNGPAAASGARPGSDTGARAGGEVEAPETMDQTPDRVEPPEPFGGDAQKLFDAAPRPRPVVDPPPDDLLTTDDPPADYSRPDFAPETTVKISEIPFESPSTSRRTQSLPGIFVGQELVKQTHLYLGQEVRVVSPLSDPSNPDANGTPIPFNRDYRVAGIFFTGMYEYDLKYVYVTLGSLQNFLDRGDAIDGIEVRLTNPDDTDRFMTTFRDAFGSQYRIQDWKEINRSLFSALKLEKIAMFLVLGIVILVA